MRTIFADTSYYLALFSGQDEAHARAKARSAQERSHIVSTEYVLVEIANALSRSRWRADTAAFLRSIASDPATEIVPASIDLFFHGLDLYTLRSDKHWSLTDCISFVVMQQRGLTEALTADRHFEQAGFRALLIS